MYAIYLLKIARNKELMPIVTETKWERWNGINFRIHFLFVRLSVFVFMFASVPIVRCYIILFLRLSNTGSDYFSFGRPLCRWLVWIICTPNVKYTYHIRHWIFLRNIFQYLFLCSIRWRWIGESKIDEQDGKKGFTTHLLQFCVIVSIPSSIHSNRRLCIALDLFVLAQCCAFVMFGCS